MNCGTGIRPIRLAVWILLLGSLARADSLLAGPTIGAWELPRGAGLQASDLASRHGWKPLAPGSAKGPFAGGLAIENQALVVVLPAGGREIILLSKGDGPAAGARHALALVGSRDRQTGGLDGIHLIDYDEGEAVVGFAAGEVEARLKLELGKCFVEVIPGKSRRRAASRPGQVRLRSGFLRRRRAVRRPAGRRDPRVRSRRELHCLLG